MSKLEDILAIDGDKLLSHIYDPNDYNPQQAHLYYEQHKKLKGRQQAVAQIPKGRRNGKAPPLINKHAGVKLKPKPKGKSSAQRKKEVDARVAALSAKLDRLRVVLAALVKQAKERSGVTTPLKTDTKSAVKTKTTDSKLTVQQKAAKAAYDKQYAKDHPPTADEKAKQLEQQIAEVTDKIQQMRAQLAEARSAAATKRTSSSVGAGDKSNK